jgi:DNA-binding transcriptional MocR family regulator
LDFVLPALGDEDAAVTLDTNAAALRHSLQHGRGRLYRRLAEALERGITAGTYPVGSRLPAERTLAEELGVSRVTVVAAYEVLEESGLVRRRRGSGTHVVALPLGGDPWAARPGAPHALMGRAHLSTSLDDTGTDIGFTIAALPGAEEALGEAIRFASDRLPALLATYGYTVQGWLPLRAAIAARYTSMGLPTDPDEIIITAGAQQAIHLVVSSIVSPGGSVVVEDPTYPGILDVVRAGGANPVPVPVDGNGLRTEELPLLLRRWAPRLMYVVATHHNPTGVVLSEARRRELIELAASERIPLIDDLSLLGLSLTDAPEPAPLATLDPHGLVITIGSLSKLVWGGLRVGWVRASPSLVGRMTRLKLAHDHGNSIMSQGIALGLIERLDAIAVRRRETLRHRFEALTDALETSLPDWRWTRPSGGLSLWVRMPRGDSTILAELAARRGVAIVPGPTFSASGAFDDRIRLPFGDSPENIRLGIERLAAAWAEYEPLARTTAPRMQAVV